VRAPRTGHRLSLARKKVLHGEKKPDAEMDRVEGKPKIPKKIFKKDCRGAAASAVTSASLGQPREKHKKKRSSRRRCKKGTLGGGIMALRSEAGAQVVKAALWEAI